MGILRQVQTEATTNLISSHRKPLLLILWSLTQWNSIRKKNPQKRERNKKREKEKKLCSYPLRFEKSTWIKEKKKKKEEKGRKYVRIPYAPRIREKGKSPRNTHNGGARRRPTPINDPNHLAAIISNTRLSSSSSSLSSASDKTLSLPTTEHRPGQRSRDTQLWEGE